MVSGIRKKHLGQHFLVNPDIGRRIVSFLEGSPETVIEIGPGDGILTEHLVRGHDRVILVERDPDLLPGLNQRFSDRSKILEGDALETVPTLLKSLQNAAIVSNLPYNISAPLTFQFCEMAGHISEMVLMYQKEVADRIRIEPGPLHLAVMPFFDVKERMRLNPRSFSPPPKVDSAVLHFKRKAEFGVEPEPVFFRYCRAVFENRRKLLYKNIKRFGTDAVHAMEQLDLSDKIRVDQLSVEQLLSLYKELRNHGISL